MSDLLIQNEEQEAAAPSGASELDILKQRARMMGVQFSNNIGLESLRERVNAKMAADEEDAVVNESIVDEDVDIVGDVSTGEINGLEAAAQLAAQRDTVLPGSAAQAAAVKASGEVEKPKSVRQRLYEENMRLIRVRITNMDPKKKDLHGEILTVANEYIGTVKKFVPYGEVTDEGFHLEYILYQELEQRRFLSIRTTKDRRTGAPSVTTAWAKEFALEVLPPLTEEELKVLAQAQIAAGSVE